MTKLYKKLIVPTIAFATALTFYSCNNSDIVEAINNVGEKVDNISAVVEKTSNESIAHCDSSAKTIVDALGYNTPFTIGGDSILFQDRIYVDSASVERLESKGYLRSKIGGVSTKSSNERSSYKHRNSHKKNYHNSHAKKNNGASSSTTNNQQSPSLPALDTDSLNKLVNGVYKDNKNEGMGNLGWFEITCKQGSYDRSDYEKN